jgi:hypothetical protein
MPNSVLYVTSGAMLWILASIEATNAFEDAVTTALRGPPLNITSARAPQVTLRPGYNDSRPSVFVDIFFTSRYDLHDPV